MKKKSVIVIGAVLVLFTLQSCSSKPEETLLSRYFHSLAMNDNATLSSMALEPISIEVENWKIVGVTEDRITAAALPELSKKEAEFKKKLEDHVGPTMDASDALDAAKEELSLARTGGAKQAARKKVDEMQAKYDQEYGLHKELQKNYNEAKTEAAREEEITHFSLGAGEVANIRDLTGDVTSKEVDVNIVNKAGAAKTYKLYLRKYELKDEISNLRRNGRWVIIKFEPIG